MNALQQMDTPKSSGSTSACPRRLTLSAVSHYKLNTTLRCDAPLINSPLATSSPMVMPKQQHPSSRTNTIRSADLSSLFTTPEEAAFEAKHNELLQSIQAQRDLVEQAAAAISYCRKKFCYSGTSQELSAQRLLLVSQERLALFNNQMDDFRGKRFITSQLEDIPESDDFDNEDDAEENSVVGMTSINARRLFYTLFIDKFIIQLNPSFSVKKIDKETSYAFLVLCRFGGCLHATQVANVLDIGEMRNQKVKIKELIMFDNLPYEFCVMVEVFAMRIGRRLSHKWQSMWDFAARTIRSLKTTFSASNTNGAATAMDTPNSSEFRRCGYILLNRDSLGLGEKKFFLSDADYPLEGSIEIHARFLSQPNC